MTQFSRFLVFVFFLAALSAGFFLSAHSAAAAYNPSVDLNTDGCVNSPDFTVLANNYYDPTPARGDVNNDGKVDARDIAYMMDTWSQCLTLGAGDYTFTLQSGGLTRTYLAHVPSSYRIGSTTPVVLNFHGGGSEPSGQRFISQMNTTSNQNGFIVVYPQGTTKIAGSTETSYFWNPGFGDLGWLYPASNIKNVDDVGFVSDMIDDLRTKFNVNTKRVYATGLSNGGIFSHTLGCKLSHKIAAIAAVEGEVWLNTTTCTPSRPVPVMIIHGTADNYIPYNGGPPVCVVLTESTWKSVDEDAAIWKTENSCSNSFTTQQVTSDVSCKIYSSCAGGSEVAVCTVQDGGHTWSGGLAYIPPSNDPTCAIGNIGTASANDMIWTFFSAHPLP